MDLQMLKQCRQFYNASLHFSLIDSNIYVLGHLNPLGDLIKSFSSD